MLNQYTPEQIRIAEETVEKLVDMGYIPESQYDAKVRSYLKNHFDINSTDGKDASTSSPS
jgi:hypothetical protein